MAVLTALLTVQLIRAQTTSALPLAGAPSSTAVTVGWVPEPPNRGTLSIIISCMLTMAICVWTALHLNVPSPGQTLIQSWTQSVKWMLTGLFAPELVVYAAWRQYVSARTLQKRIDGLGSNANKETAHTVTGDHLPLVGKISERMHYMLIIVQKAKIFVDDGTYRERPGWSMMHGFYAGMGGFVFDIDPAFASVLRPSNSQRQRLTLTPRAIALLADCGLIPDISKEEIDDKSKANVLAKLLVCLQAGWMVLQTVARVAYGLPVTLLEVNTIGHVICAFLIYTIWWHKPQLVSEPTPLRGEWVQPICAYMWMSSRMSCRPNDPRQKSNLPLLGQPRVGELAELAFRPCHLAKSKESTETRGAEGVSPAAKWEDHKLPATSKNVYKQGFGYLSPVAEIQSQKFIPYAAGESTKSSPSLGQSETPPARWRLALDAMQMFPALSTFEEPEFVDPERQWHQLHGDQLLYESAGNWPSDALLRNFRGVLMGMALWFASMAFGGVHAAAWNGSFPSKIEAWLWRSSSVYIMASGLIWLCINFFGQVSNSFNTYWDEILARRAGWLSHSIIGSLCAVCGLAYGFARIFLVVESVISLRRLPIGAYQTPDWSQLIPHL